MSADDLSAWKPLTDNDRIKVMESLPNALDGFLKTWGWLHFAKAIEQACREKQAASEAKDSTSGGGA